MANVSTSRGAFARQLAVLLATLGWSMSEFARKTGVHSRTVSEWRRGRLPSQSSFKNMIVSLRNVVARPLVDSLENAYRSESNLHVVDEDAEQIISAAAAEQIPAAYRFGIRYAKIDALEETSKPTDQRTAEELYVELKEKTNALNERLERTNSDKYVRDAAGRLLTSLGSSFDAVRPGVVLSRMRSLEAIVQVYDSEEGRTQLFPDAIAEINDVNLSGQDLLSTFPIVRQIERERLALSIEKTPLLIGEALKQLTSINNVASNSDIVTIDALAALKENDADIDNSVNDVSKSDLVADKVLITRNFVSAALRSLREVGFYSWDVVGDDFKDGARHAARILPPLAVIALLTAISGPIAGLVGLLRSDVFRPVGSAVSKVKNAASRREKPRKSNNNDVSAPATDAKFNKSLTGENVAFIEHRPKSTDPYKDTSHYVIVVDGAEKHGSFKTQKEAKGKACDEGYRPVHVARVRHQQDQDVPDHWRQDPC